MKIQIVRAKGGWFFRIVARNGRTLCHSEVYSTLDSCRRTVRRLINVMIDVGVEEV